MHKGHIWNQYWNNCKDTFKKQIKESVCVHKLLKRFFLTLVNHLKQSVLFQKEKELEMNHVRLSYTIIFYHFLNKCSVFGAILQHFHWSTISLEIHYIRANIDIICGCCIRKHEIILQFEIYKKWTFNPLVSNYAFFLFFFGDRWISVNIYIYHM